MRRQEGAATSKRVPSRNSRAKSCEPIVPRSSLVGGRGTFNLDELIAFAV